MERNKKFHEANLITTSLEFRFPRHEQDKPSQYCYGEQDQFERPDPTIRKVLCCRSLVGAAIGLSFFLGHA